MDFASTRSASGLVATRSRGDASRHEGSYHDEQSRWKRSQPVLHLRGTRTVTNNTLTGVDSPLARATVRTRDGLTVPTARAFRVRHAVALHADDMRKGAARELRLKQPPYADPPIFHYGMLQPLEAVNNRAAFSCPQRGDDRIHPVDHADKLRAASLVEVEKARAAAKRAANPEAALMAVPAWDSTHRNVTQTLWRPRETCR
eukprot:g931.t1